MSCSTNILFPSNPFAPTQVIQKLLPSGYTTTKPACNMESTSGSSSPHSSNENEGGIMNRGREVKGLPSSFSANLGRDATPIPARHEGAPGPASGRSVKSIVALFESSPRSKALTPSKPPRPDTARLLVSSTDLQLASALQRQPESLQALDVEEYSLTLLKYRKYFTERPLGRCLDDDAGEKAINTKTGGRKKTIRARPSKVAAIAKPCSSPLEEESGKKFPPTTSETVR